MSNSIEPQRLHRQKSVLCCSVRYTQTRLEVGFCGDGKKAVEFFGRFKGKKRRGSSVRY
jgi:hypothetical protein